VLPDLLAPRYANRSSFHGVQELELAVEGASIRVVVPSTWRLQHTNTVHLPFRTHTPTELAFHVTGQAAENTLICQRLELQIDRESLPAGLVHYRCRVTLRVGDRDTKHLQSALDQLYAQCVKDSF
jgi:hypothetical protein